MTPQSAYNASGAASWAACLLRPKSRPDTVALSDPDQPDHPLVYVNEAFELMTGYTRGEIIGHNCRFLQGEDRDQPEIDQVREALRERKPVTVTLRNYRKDGSLF